MNKISNLINYLKSEGFLDEVNYLIKLSQDTQDEVEVKSGENLSIIASRYPGVSPDNIIAHNNLETDVLQAGQILRIPVGSSAPPPTPRPQTPSNKPGEVVTIRDGETLDDVAKRYPGISGENIRDYNNIKMHKPGGGKDPYPLVHPNQEIIIPPPEAYPREVELTRFIDADMSDFSEDEVIAATLLGEGGSEFSGTPIMERVMAVMMNRSRLGGGTVYQMAFNKDFSVWKLSENHAAVITGFRDSDNPNIQRRWKEAMRIAKGKIASSDVAGATHYYNPARTSGTPDFVNSGPCGGWEITLDPTDGDPHIYGRGGPPWEACSAIRN